MSLYKQIIKCQEDTKNDPQLEIEREKKPPSLREYLESRVDILAAQGKIHARLFREASKLTEEILEIGE